MTIKNSFIQTNICALSEASEFIQAITSEHYQTECKPVFQATIGAHFRHVIEHYQCFFEQLKQGHFCYDSRKRDLQLETNPEFARRELLSQIILMRNLDEAAITQSYTINDEAVEGNIETSLARELVFLQSHTTHHFAIIAAIARSIGIQTDEDFGVAISTKSHQYKIQNTENIVCAQ